MMSFKVNYLDKTARFDQPIRLVDLVGDNDFRYICAKVNNNAVKGLATEINEDANITFLTLKDEEAIETYRSSLCYLVAMAFYRHYPQYRLHFTFSVSRAMHFEIINAKKDITPSMLSVVRREMYKLVKLNIPLTRLKITKDKADDIFKQMGQYDKSAILKYRPEKYSHLYECGGYYNYFNSQMVYSTGYLRKYSLRLYQHGALLQYPRAEDEGEVPPYQNSRAYMRALYSSQAWAKEMKVQTIAMINDKMKTREDTVDFINECEARHARQIVELGNQIEKGIKRIRLICIAGPSSSGKTTFANRLRIELMSRGIEPVMISLDNYYLPVNKVPRNEKNEPDFECLEALNVKLFNEQMNALIEGEEIKMPIYYFGKKPTEYKKLKLRSTKSVIIVEGIHALNPKMTNAIHKDKKYRIYISPQIQVNIDHDNPLSLTDLRLLRRITRDYQFRDMKPIDTIKMWHNVRAGEFKYIYKGIENANYVFNSFSFFELNAYKKHTLPLLLEISRSNIYYPTVERLIRMIKCFKVIADSDVPNNSIIREFIGGSCFE